MLRKRLVPVLILIIAFTNYFFLGLDQKCFGQCPTTLCYQSCCNSNGPGRHSCSMGSSNNVGSCTCANGSPIPCICGSSGPNCRPIATPTPYPDCAYVCMPSTGNYQANRCPANKEQHDMYVGGYCCCDISPTPSPSQFPSPSPMPSISLSPLPSPSSSVSPSPCMGCGVFNDPIGTVICGSEPGSLAECGASCNFYPIGYCPTGYVCVGDPSGTCPSGHSCFSGSVHCEASSTASPSQILVPNPESISPQEDVSTDPMQP